MCSVAILNNSDLKSLSTCAAAIVIKQHEVNLGASFSTQLTANGCGGHCGDYGTSNAIESESR